MTFAILGVSGNDAARWQSLIDLLPREHCDIHYTPAYARVQSRLGKVLAASYVWGDYFILQPFMLREGSQKDIVSLYGAGGPVTNMTNGVSPQLWERFDEQFAKWREQNSIICEYAQLHPLLRKGQRNLLNEAPFTIEYVKDAVWVDANLSDTKLLESFSRNRQRGVKAAQEAGIKIGRTDNPDVFINAYKASMARLNMSDRWKYPDAVWWAHFTELSPEYLTILVAQKLDGEVEASLLLLHAYGRTYAHFLGSYNTGILGVNDLLYYESMKLGRDLGDTVYFIGGGTTAKADDSLLAYKAGFSEHRAQICTYKRIFNRQAYETACAGIKPTTFFPAYRADAVRSAP